METPAKTTAGYREERVLRAWLDLPAAETDANVANVLSEIRRRISRLPEEMKEGTAWRAVEQLTIKNPDKVELVAGYEEELRKLPGEASRYLRHLAACCRATEELHRSAEVPVVLYGRGIVDTVREKVLDVARWDDISAVSQEGASAVLETVMDDGKASPLDEPVPAGELTRAEVALRETCCDMFSERVREWVEMLATARQLTTDWDAAVERLGRGRAPEQMQLSEFPAETLTGHVLRVRGELQRHLPVELLADIGHRHIVQGVLEARGWAWLAEPRNARKLDRLVTWMYGGWAEGEREAWTRDDGEEVSRFAPAELQVLGEIVDKRLPDAWVEHRIRQLPAEVAELVRLRMLCQHMKRDRTTLAEFVKETEDQTPEEWIGYPRPASQLKGMMMQIAREFVEKHSPGELQKWSLAEVVEEAWTALGWEWRGIEGVAGLDAEEIRKLTEDVLGMPESRWWGDETRESDCGER